MGPRKTNIAVTMLDHLVHESAAGIMVPGAGEAFPHTQQLGRPVFLHLSAVCIGSLAQSCRRVVAAKCWALSLRRIESGRMHVAR